MPEMKISAIAPWFGGKRTMADDIVRELGPHTQFFEPFCAALSIILNMPPCAYEIANDLHGDVTNLARCLQAEVLADEIYRRAQRTLFSDAILRDACARVQDDITSDEPDVDRAYWLFVRSWMMRNGVAGLTKFRGHGEALAVRYTANGGSATVRFRNAVESIPAWHERLRNVVILRRDAFELFDKFDDTAGLAIYADPPYCPESRSGYNGTGAHARYVHEFRHDGEGNDHIRLRDALARFQRARVVVSYYDCPRVRQLYAGWTIVDKTCAKNLTRATGPETTAPEILILNGPSYDDPRPGGLFA